MNISKNGNIVLLEEKKISAEIESAKKVTIHGTSEQVIDWPGEYEVNGISVFGVAENEEETAFKVGIEGIRIFFPAQQAIAYNEEEMGKIGEPEAIYVAADSSSRSAKEWKKFIEEIDPRVLFFGENGEKTQALLKELGVAEAEKEEKIELTVRNLPTDKTRYISLV